MGTSFDVIYSRFLQKIEDYRLTELDDADIDKMMFGWLLSAIAQIRELKVSGFTFNDTDTAFSYKLSNLEIEVLALGMVQEWLEPQLESVLLTRQFVSSKEEQFFAQHNHLNMLMNLQDKVKKQKKQLISRYKILHNSYLSTEETVSS